MMDVAWLVLKYRVSRRRPPHPPVAGIQFHRDFWRGHAGHRLGDERRIHSKEESDEVKQRIAEVLRDKGIVGNNGRFLPGAPSNVAIRTHILDRDRNPDGVDIRGRPLSNGNTIVGIVREHPDYPGTAKLQTTMLRRDEWRGEMQQPWTPKALRVERVFTHSDAGGDDVGGTPEGMEYTQLKSDEPMDIAFQLLKERKSPEAMRRKLAYDKQYEKTPERRKYQRELHAERRRRGIYGTGDHMDVSHTQGGRLTLEPEHANRARHFKGRGTLRVV